MLRGFSRVISQRSTTLEASLERRGIEQPFAQAKRAVAERIRQRDDAIGERVHAFAQPRKRTARGERNS